MKLEPFRLERFFAQYEFCTEHLLGCSDAETWTTAELLAMEEGAQEAFLGQSLGYTEASGSTALRVELARLYQSITKDQVLVCAGAQEAIYLFMTTWLEPGDRVVVLTPCYQSLSELPEGLKCEMIPWALEPPWRPDLGRLAELLPGTRLLVVNFPHSPTGAHLTHEEQAELIRLCRQHEVWLFSDEVYRDTEHRPEDRLPAACDLYERALSLGVMSKSYGLAGLRIGWLALQDRSLYERLAARKDYTSLCNSAPSEFLAALALRHGAQLLERNRNILLGNLSLKVPAPIRWLAPRAGTVAFPLVDVPDVEAWCHELARQGVLLVPGSLFGYPGHVRMGLGRRGYSAGLEQLRKLIK